MLDSKKLSLFKEFTLKSFTLSEVLKIQLLAMALINYDEEGIFIISPPIRYFYNALYPRLAIQHVGETELENPAFEDLLNEATIILNHINEKGFDFNYHHLWGYLIRKSFKRGKLFEEKDIRYINIFTIFIGRLHELINKNLVFQAKMANNVKEKRKDIKANKKYQDFLIDYAEDLRKHKLSLNREPEKYDFLGINKKKIEKILKAFIGQLIKSKMIGSAQAVHNFFYIVCLIYGGKNANKEFLITMIAETLRKGLLIEGKLFQYPPYPIPKTIPKTKCLAQQYEDGFLKKVFECVLEMDLFTKPFEKKSYDEYFQPSYKKRLISKDKKSHSLSSSSYKKKFLLPAPKSIFEYELGIDPITAAMEELTLSQSHRSLLYTRGQSTAETDLSQEKEKEGQHKKGLGLRSCSERFFKKG